MERLTKEDLVALIQSVFPHFPEDKRLAVLVDVPRRPASDDPDWAQRRKLAEEWAALLGEGVEALSLEGIDLVAYPDVGSDNADLPPAVFLMNGVLPPGAEGLSAIGQEIPLEKLFERDQLILAPTEHSATAPLKNAAPRFGFRAATMPGFSEKMIPALKLDYAEVGRRVGILKEKLDRAEGAELLFRVDGALEFSMHFDLRFTRAHTSSGRFPVKGTAGNLPSGETYIVPFEGRPGEPSRTKGTLPVEIKGEVALFLVMENRAVAVDSEGAAGRLESEHLQREPAYGNMAELGFGVLHDFGLRPIGEILLDEKLGIHVAFGRSDHFGGRVGPADFSSPQEVVHLDRIYLQAVQPRIVLESAVLVHEKNLKERIFEKGKYLVF
jgi:hypothetical protein